MDINSKTDIICLIGNPIEHSLSPNIHNYLLNKYKINSKYVCFDVEKNNIEKAIEGIRALGIKGANITIPHKVDVMMHLDEIDKNAELIGSVNTIKNKNGKLVGYNTDGIGFVKSILDKGYKVKDKKVLIIGAGGACRSIAVELAANDVSFIDIRNRSIKNASIISETINNNFKTRVTYSTENINKDDLEGIDILINTTPVGMDKDKSNCPINEKIQVDKNILVCDIVYNPHETKLISWAKNNNLNVIYGIDMLINQAIHGFYIWTGINVSEKSDIEKILKGI